MQTGRIETCAEGAVTRIRVTDSGTFANSAAVQACGLMAVGVAGGSCRFELGACRSLDSTFIGVMALLALRGRANGGAVEILNATERVRQQITGLGIGSLFTFRDGVEAPAEWRALEVAGRAADVDRRATIRTVIAAHETLGRVNPENVARFRNVVDLMKGDEHSSGGA